MTAAEAAKLVRREATAQQAADRLVRLAKNRSLSALGQLKDDTTLLVVDLNPSGLVTWPALEQATPVPCSCVMS